jgi:hypothetical protein
METIETPCRHEYVKIYQRRYKEYERRLVSTRGYLPTGFSNKDFSFLTPGAYCFCTKCRKCLYPTRGLSNRGQNTAVAAQVSDNAPIEAADNIWIEEIPDTSAATSLEIEVEELQVEAADATDIVEKEIAANQEDNMGSEQGEE